MLLVNDDAQLLIILKFDRVNDLLESTEISIESEDYKSRFKRESSHISIQGKFVFLYQNSLIQYFEISSTTLYFLGEEQSNLETVNMAFLGEYSSASNASVSEMIITLLSPGEL
jgi:hypothetical protein